MCFAADAVRAVADPPPFRAPAPRPRRAPHTGHGGDQLVLLGTAGGANPKATRAGFANAVVVGGHAYLHDCGEGANTQAWRAGIGMHSDRHPAGGATVDAVFLSHLHSDHVIDLANLFLGQWPTHDVHVYGPGPAGLPIAAYPPGRAAPLLYPDEPTPGTRSMVDHLFRAFAYNINVRIADEGRHDPTAHVHVHEIGVPRHGADAASDGPDIDVGVAASGATPATAAPAMEPFVVRPLDANGVRVTAILVQHAPVFPALAYRFDTPRGSVVFSGDTGPCDNVVRLAHGADVLVHEVIDVEYLARRLQSLPNRDAVISHLTVSHTAPADAGRIAQRAGVRRLVLSHLVPGDDEFAEEDWEARAAPFFDGEVVCGVDLDRFTLGSA